MPREHGKMPFLNIKFTTSKSFSEMLPFLLQLFPFIFILLALTS